MQDLTKTQPSPHVNVDKKTAKNTAKSKFWFGVLLATIGAILFAGKAILVKYCYRIYPIDSETLLFLRMLLAAPFFIIILIIQLYRLQRLKTQWLKPIIQARTRILLMGITGYYLASYLDFLGLQTISATLERLILFLYPSLVLILSAIFFRKPITWQTLLCCLISYVGILVVFQLELITQINSSHIMFGSLCVFLSALAYATYLVIAGELLKSINTFLLTAIASLIACLLCCIQFFWQHHFAQLIELPASIWQLSLVNATLCTVIPMFSVSLGIQYCGARMASQAGLIGPIATIGMGILILNEPFNMLHAIGTVLVLIGMLTYGYMNQKQP